MAGPIGLPGDGEPDQALRPSTPWSEAGMPQRLREAIASVRRVSHQMAHELPPLEVQRFHEGPAFAPAAMREPSFDDDGIHDELPFDDGVEEVPRLDAYAIDDELPLDGMQEEPLLRDEAIRYESSLGDDAMHERLLEDSAPDESAPGLWNDPRRWEAPRDRAPLRWEARKRRGLHFTAFAVAIAFVALAGLGLGLLSGGLDAGWPRLALDALTAQSTESLAPSPAPVADPADSNAPVALPAEPKAPPERSRVVTQQMPPMPATPVIEAAASETEATSGLPLPPPPKPAFRQATTREAPSRAATREAPSRAATREAPSLAATRAAPADDRLASAADDPPSASLEEGLGGPFQPLFVKLPASRPTATRVFVHYPASAAGGPAIAMHLVRHLKAAGLTVEARAVGFPIPTQSIRYFSAVDRKRAEALRASLEGQIPGGASLPILDFTHFEPKPQAGHLEVWLSL